MKRFWKVGIAVVALAGVAALLKFTVFRAHAVDVSVVEVGKGKVEETVVNSRSGTVKAGRSSGISPEVGGRVVELPVEKGDRVHRGDLLLAIDPSLECAQVELAERGLAVAKAAQREAELNAEKAERDLDRLKGLPLPEIVTQEQLDTAQTTYDLAEAQKESARLRVDQAKAQIDVARAALEKTRLRAPFDGVVADVNAELGEWIGPSPPGLKLPAALELLDVSSISVSAPMDEVDAGRVEVGMEARIQLDSYPDRNFIGTVVRVAPYVQENLQENRTFEVESRFEDAAFAAKLLPGTSADVEVILKSRDNALRVPTYALLEGNHVLVVAGDHLESREVKTGLRNWEFTEVLSGIAVGDHVVVSLDKPEVKDGARVGKVTRAEQ